MESIENRVSSLEVDRTHVNSELKRLESKITSENEKTENKLMARLNEVQEDIKDMIKESKIESRGDSQRVADGLDRMNKQLNDNIINQTRIETKVETFTSNVDKLSDKYDEDKKYTRNTLIGLVVSVILLILSTVAKSIHFGIILPF